MKIGKYQKEFQNWYQKEKSNGLTDFKVFLDPDTKSSYSTEQIYKNLMEAINAPIIEDNQLV